MEVHRRVEVLDVPEVVRAFSSAVRFTMDGGGCWVNEITNWSPPGAARTLTLASRPILKYRWTLADRGAHTWVAGSVRHKIRALGPAR
jgi:hypothetical protein